MKKGLNAICYENEMYIYFERSVSLKEQDFYDDAPKRVAPYVRVSTDNIQQTSSYELQKTYYEDMVKRHENWTLVDIYADEGISGTSLNILKIDGENFEEYNKAKKRLVFEELLIMQLALLNLKTKYSVDVKGIEFNKNIKLSYSTSTPNSFCILA